MSEWQVGTQTQTHTHRETRRRHLQFQNFHVASTSTLTIFGRGGGEEGGARHEPHLHLRADIPPESRAGVEEQLLGGFEQGLVVGKYFRDRETSLVQQLWHLQPLPHPSDRWNNSQVVIRVG